MKALRVLAALSTASLVSLVASSGRAQDCRTPILNACVNSETLWVRPGASRFLALASTDTAPRGQFGFGVVTAYQSRPIVLRVPSPGPPGSDQYAVDNQLTAHFMWNYGLTDRLEVNMVMPVTLGQSGSGLAPITAGASLPSAALRDMRFGVSYSILQRARVAPELGSSSQDPVVGPSAASTVRTGPDGFGLAARFDVSAPTGSSGAFATEPGAVLSPGVVMDYRKGRIFAASELALRLRRTSEVLGARVGSQLFAGLGVGVDILPNELLSAIAEVRVLPGFAQQADVFLVDGRYLSRGNGATAAPAEWTLSARTASLFGGDLSIMLGGGGALPLSDDSAFGNPRFRFDLSVRYAPLGRDTDGDGVEDKFDKCPRVYAQRGEDGSGDGCPQPPPTPRAPEAPVEFGPAPTTPAPATQPAPAQPAPTTPAPATQPAPAQP
jgi:hypothetical protein